MNKKAVILCGGKSSRMGFDKRYLKYKGAYFFEIIANKITPYFDDVYCSVDTYQSDIHYPQIIDRFPNIGPMGGILSSFQTLKEEELFFIPVDLILLSSSSILEIIQAYSKDYQAIVPSVQGKIQPLVGWYAQSVLQVFFEAVQFHEYSVSKAIKKIRHHYIHFDSEAEFLNINTMRDLHGIIANLNK